MQHNANLNIIPLYSGNPKKDTLANSEDPDEMQHNANLNIIPLYSGNPKKDTLANSEDPDEMQHNAAFHQGLHCL